MGVEHEEVRAAGLKGYVRIFRYADRKSWLLYAASGVAAVVAGSALPLMDLLFGKFVTVFNNFAIGAISPEQYRQEVSRYALYFVYLFIAKFCLVYAHSLCASMAAIRTTKALRLHCLHSLLRQEMAYFDTNGDASLPMKITTEANMVTNGISERLSIFVQSCSTFIAAFVVAFISQRKLTAITICIVPAMLIIVGVCMTIEAKNEDQLIDIFARANVLSQEVFSSISTVHAYWLQSAMADRYEGYLDDLERVGRKKSPNYGVLFATEFFCIYCGYGLAFWQGIRMYASGEIQQPGHIVTVILAIVVAATSLTHIAPQIITITKSAAAAESLFRIVDRRSNIDSVSAAGLTPEHCHGDIELDGLIFSYPARPSTTVLHNLTMSIPANKTTALVGASGSGKSTIVGLLERWYDPSAGRILLDGIDIRKYNIAWLRTQIRLVQQEPLLFSGSIYDNVASGLVGTPNATATHEEKLALVIGACRLTYAHDFVMKLPGTYDTHIGERARMLSGGQKQRLAMARSIISRPSILLLDEATSALDPKSENIVQRALARVSTGRTTIVIAHKLSTIRAADNIAVMSAGRIIEQGTHVELIARNGAYARLVRAQEMRGIRDDGLSQPDPVKDALLAKQSGDDSSAHDGQSLVDEPRPNDLQNNQVANPETMSYGLFRCLWLLISEQRELWPAYIVASSMCFLGGGTFPTQAYIMAQAYQIFRTRGSDAVRRGDFWALMFFVVALANFVFYFILGWTANIIIQKVSRGYRREMFRNTMKQDMAFFDAEANATGAICSRLSIHAINLNELLGMNCGLLLINIVTIITVSCLGIAYGWKLGVVYVFAALPPLLISGYLRIRLEHRLDESTSARFASSAALVVEAIAGIRTVASFTLENDMLRMYKARLDAVAGRSIKALTSTMFWYALSQSINFLAMALGFWYGGKLVAQAEYSNEQFFVIFIAVVVGGENAATLFQYTTSITKATVSANYIFWLRQRTPHINNDFSEDNPALEELKNSNSVAVECQKLEFAYASRPASKVINTVDVQVSPGEAVALVGPSGCGKSTIINLLARFYDPTSGCIMMDNKPIRDLDLQHYRNHIALVQQEPILYQGTLRENIAFGSNNSSKVATETKIVQACKDANIHDFVISLPEGLDTEIGTRGSRLSGGQRQRVAIARALIRDAQILLLDEATSALDTESERRVQTALNGAMRTGSRTTITVAHRLSTIQDAKRIIVFMAGQVAEVGTHAQLLEMRGIYHEMCESQALDLGLRGQEPDPTRVS